jgi:hypothetical protein
MAFLVWWARSERFERRKGGRAPRAEVPTGIRLLRAGRQVQDVHAARLLRSQAPPVACPKTSANFPLFHDTTKKKNEKKM